MLSKKNSPLNVADDDVDVDLLPFLVRYKDGRIERFLSSPFVAATENPSANRGVATRDVVINLSTGVSARLFLPSRAAAAAMAARRRLPLVVYIHGGSFCTESAFCRTYHRYATSLAASAGALVVSVEYRLAPEHPIPAAYDDTWSALQWVASLADPWLAAYADPRRTFLAGDSAGGNIAYHMAVRASTRCTVDGIDVEGVIMVHPYFWGPERLPSEAVWDGAAVLPPDGVDKLWPFVTEGQAGNGDARINPPDEEIASLTCRRVLMAVAEKDTLRDRGVLLLARIRDCAAGAGGEVAVALVVSEGEDHGFHLYSPLRATSRKLMDSIVSFINQPLVLGVPTRPFKDPFGYGMDTKRYCTTMASYGYDGATSASLKTGRGANNASNSKANNHGLLFACPAMTRPNSKTYKQQRLWPPAALLPGGTHVTKNCF
ncbi:hypothetical protein BS78_K254600 [Paspalum vaginatum]|uniref:Alpha/beta hydrolase fold-3 domain-containing protein n=1 Tax=Paspalum vaginatum TaxID=158149 RepID=A0A9W7X8N3_9POAL|nr:hypothetical protein BS78_K254600 [Paspalum vaginatum]